MKKIILSLLICVVSLAASAQLYTSMGIGASITKIKPVAELNIGYRLNYMILQGGFITHLDRINPAIFNSKMGINLPINEDGAIVIAGGIAYQLKSADKKELNKSTYIAGVEYVRYISNAAWYVGFNQSGKFSMATIGLRYYFNVF